ncbi:hypothetical protein [Streptomyces sp. NPDC047097]|uniref:DUF7417 domain-containing protein n=1 Tax=Streptomyces sp. NPDC047097 TaxID=3155260 RepID=UPI003405C43E
MSKMGSLALDLTSYEAGELDFSQSLTLFSTLIKSRMAWSLQGHYGRTARALIDQGLITRDGEIVTLPLEAA